MPDLPTRKQREKELAAALLLLFQTWQVQTDPLSGLETPTEQEIANGVALAVVPALTTAHQEAARQLAAMQQFATSERALLKKSEIWAIQHGQQLGREIAETTISGISAGKSPAELYPDQRAALIAATEITRAITIGEALVLVAMWDELGISFQQIWYTELDARVCPVCAPLHGVGQQLWQSAIPGGPPAHPNCRCWLEYEAA